ncbi:hypothetical protein LIER_13610 [Lithospermum erythrorhizon]|uniref:Uncharacterized protein n=1 Tax=Lithospermum erythrorhizon TaxID=34254 RepID=A0AAV3PW12_LITER
MNQHIVIVVDQEKVQFKKCISTILQYPSENPSVTLNQRVHPGKFTIGPVYAKDGMNIGEKLKFALAEVKQQKGAMAKAFLKRSNIDLDPCHGKYNSRDWNMLMLISFNIQLRR